MIKAKSKSKNKINPNAIDANYIALLGCMDLIAKIRKSKKCPPEIQTMIDKDLKKLTDMMEVSMGVIKTPLKIDEPIRGGVTAAEGVMTISLEDKHPMWTFKDGLENK